MNSNAYDPQPGDIIAFFPKTNSKTRVNGRVLLVHQTSSRGEYITVGVPGRPFGAVIDYAEFKSRVVVTVKAARRAQEGGK